MGLPVPNLVRKSKHVSQNCIKKSDMSVSDFTPHETEEIAEELDCECGADCIVQPLEPKGFVMLKLATKKTMKYFVELIKEMEPDGYKIKFLGNDSQIGHFVSQSLKILQ